MRGQYFPMIWGPGGTAKVIAPGGLVDSNGDPIGASTTVTTFSTHSYTNDASNFDITTVADLTFAVLANKKYWARYYILSTCGTGAAVMRIKPSYPTGVTSVWSGQRGTVAAGNAGTSQPPANTTQLTQYTGSGTSTQDICFFEMVVQVGSSAGNISFGYSSGVGVVSALVGSWVSYEEFD